MKDKNMESINKIEDEYSSHNESASADHSVYYGVYISNDLQTVNSNTNLNVFQEKSSVLQLLKQHKRARFKAFTSYCDAADFAMNGNENPNNNSTSDYNMQKSALDSSSQLIGEKPSPFKGPKPQDMIVLRKSIEKDDYESVERIIWRNPRYLISSGDTPSILQEGSRYNALHVAAKAKNHRITELILNTVANVEFVKLLYGDDENQNSIERADVFLDLYLNTPDKALNETPLHFAVKFGAVEVVEVLVSYPQCDKTVKNKYGQTPKMMICDRCEKTDTKLYKRMEHLLEETFYVPVLRAEDNSIPPKIGEPFSPENPPILNADPLSPQFEIQAYAGPMNKKGAEQFRKVWKTPPRSLKFSTPLKTSQSCENVASLKYKDPLKGLEIVGKALATQFDISWKEYWPFLDSFVDIASEDGLNLLENFLKSRILDLSRSITTNLESSNCDITANVSSITELCQAFQAFHLNSSSDDSLRNDELDSKISNNFSPFLCLEKACQVFAYRFANNILNAVNGNLVNILDNDIKQFEIVVLSYMEDDRFSIVNFNCVHYRLSYLIAHKLYFKFDKDNEKNEMYKKIENLIDVCTKSFDLFSSDDESVNTKEITTKKGTSIKKQLLCIAHSILNQFNQNLEPHCDNLTEKDSVLIWENLTPCSCILYARKARKLSNLQRNSSRKYNAGHLPDSVRKLFNEEKESPNSDQNSDETFFTPYASEDEEEEFLDAKQSVDYDIYIGGKLPSKTDANVYNALKYSGCDICRDKYPNVYLWRHNIAQFSEQERNSWRLMKEHEFPSPISPFSASTPQKNNAHLMTPPSKSWLRVTGVNSPKSTRKRNAVCVLSSLY